MTLTYTEIEQQKNSRIFIFFMVVVLFYFLAAVVLGTVVKAFIVLNSESAGRVSLLLSGKALSGIIIFALLAALLHILFSVHNAVRFITENLQCKIIDPADAYHKRFSDIVDEVNVATGSRYKIRPMVIPTVAMNAFAAADHRGIAIVGVTEGLLSKLNRDQLQAVVAHEVAHIASNDSLQTTIACSLFGVYAAILVAMKKIFEGGRVRSSGRGGGNIIVLMLLIYLVLSVMQFFYTLIRLVVSRNRELRADAIAVRLTRNPVGLSEALYAISRGWRGFGNIDSSLEALFIVNPVNAAIDEKEGFLANLLSTHPPIEKRVALLADMAHADVSDIQANVLSQEKMKDAARDVVEDKARDQWMVMDGGKGWQGPFTIPQLMTLNILKPWTMVKGLKGDTIKQAKYEPLLMPVLDNEIQGLKMSLDRCPKCRQPLVEEHYEGAPVHRCVFCEGVLVEKGRIPRIIIRQEVGFSERVKKLAEIAQRDGCEKMRAKIRPEPGSLLKCPRCGTLMLRNFYTMAYLVEVDMCNACNLVWFDKDELEMVQYLIENKKSGIKEDTP